MENKQNRKSIQTQGFPHPQPFLSGDSPSWPSTSFIAENDFKLVIYLFLTPGSVKILYVSHAQLFSVLKTKSIAPELHPQAHKAFIYENQKLSYSYKRLRY